MMDVGTLFDLSESCRSAHNALNLPLPTRRVEHWKYTDLSRLFKAPFPLLQSQDGIQTGLEASLLEDECYLVQWQNGLLYSSELPEGVTLSKVDTPVEASHQLSVMAQAAACGAPQTIAIEIDKGVSVDRPIYLSEFFCHDKMGSGLRHILIAVKPGAEVYFIDDVRHLSGDSSLANDLIQLNIEENAQCHWLSIWSDDGALNRICTVEAKVHSHAHFNTFSVQNDIHVGRLDMDVHLLGDGASSCHNGVYQLEGRAHVDNHITVHHRASHTRSDQLYKGLGDGQSTFVFNGKAVVHKGIKQIVAHQKNQNLLLSKKASIFTKPDLEIYADDVQCSHGATTGQMDENALFYLRSRGVSLECAKRLLQKAFLKEVLEKIHVPVYRRLCARLLDIDVAAPEWDSLTHEPRGEYGDAPVH